MTHFIKTFRTDDTGSSTLDWMVLTVGLLLLGAAGVASLTV